MSEKDQKIMETFAALIPQLDEVQKANVLAFGEGMAFLINQQRARPASERG